MEELLYKLNPWWKKEFIEKSIKRNKYLDIIKENIGDDLILFLTGLRRIGKTTLMHQTIDFLIKEKKINPKYILFLNLDHINFINHSIHSIIDKYKEINGIKYDDFIYLFLDEITSKENSEQEIKNLFDIGNCKIFCSSSIASLLRDKKAYLTGRTKTIEVFPLDYIEFLQFKEINIDSFDESLNKKWFKKYMQIGGIPYYVLTEDIDYLNELINSIIYKDIISAYNLKNDKEVFDLLKLLCQRIGKPLSYNKLSKILNLSDDTVKRYISYFEKTYLFYSIEKYSKSVNENLTSSKKFYICDLGLKRIISSNKELGFDFENLVFLKIKNLKPNYYLEKGIEIDFITNDFLIESKYESELNEKQQILFDKINKKNKIIVKDYKFFIN